MFSVHNFICNMHLHNHLKECLLNVGLFYGFGDLMMPLVSLGALGENHDF